jgi:uncharacterized protein (TIGR02246 family)
LSDQLAELSAKLEIQELTARYNLAADTGDGDGVAATFTPDGTFVIHGGGTTRTISGHAELNAMVAGRALGVTVHVTADSIIELDGDVAEQRCTLILNRRIPEDGRISHRIGRYVDRVERTPGGWKFANRVMYMDTENEGFIPLAG